MTKTTLEVLTTARALIENPANWWNGGDDGKDDEERDTLCLQLAISKAADDDVYVWKPACIAVARHIGKAINCTGALFDFNDEHTHAEVIALLDLAIAAESATVTSGDRS